MSHPDVTVTPVTPPAYVPNIVPGIIPESQRERFSISKPITQREKQQEKTKPPIYYPESDDMPMAENTVQYRYLTKIKGSLEFYYKNDDDVFIAGDLFWYPVEGEPDIKYAPDVMVALDRPKGDRRSYRQWEEGGIPPQVIFEIWSPGNRGKDKEKKFAFYNKYGVEEYYTYDLELGEMEGWLRTNNRLEKINTMQGWRSPRLGIQFMLEDTPDGLKMEIYDAKGQRFLTHVEVADAREAAEVKVKEEAEARTLAETKVQEEAEARALAEAEAARFKAQLQAALEQLEKAGLTLPEIDES